MLGCQVSRSKLLVAKLGVGVDVATPRDHLGFDRPGGRIELSMDGARRRRRKRIRGGKRANGFDHSEGAAGAARGKEVASAEIECGLYGFGDKVPSQGFASFEEVHGRPPDRDRASRSLRSGERRAGLVPSSPFGNDRLD